MKNLKEMAMTGLPRFVGKILGIAAAILIVAAHSCKEVGCDYDNLGTGCRMADSLNLSTGIDATGVPIVPAVGAVDPSWKLINNPPLLFDGDPLLTATISDNAYVVNFLPFGPPWVNQTGVSALGPVDMGPTLTGYNSLTVYNSIGKNVPYVFERSFCVLQKTSVNINFFFDGDGEFYFELIDNTTGIPVPFTTSGLVTNPSLPFPYFAPAVSLPVGSYSIRGYLASAQFPVSPQGIGFSMLGSVTTTTNGDQALSSNATGCCDNNTISILNILEEFPQCNGVFDPGDLLGVGWTFILTGGPNNITATTTTDINGNIFFSGLPDGTYTVTSVPPFGWTPSNPVSGTATITISGNSVVIQEFYHCSN